ncbi:alpha/beta hydrolase [Aquimarina sp. AU474]|uniref:alpha/beta hydrolase n=1 Tax=Aquimarina sp. AU474 TaxID=2108529 RepID=UPI000D69B5DE|nr:alpha/beta fold hydrolase [Aquimarina sp. AU474]
MKIKYLTILLILIVHANLLFAQQEIEILSDGLSLSGTILSPTNKANTVVLLISGSGNTNRDGNVLNAGYTNNSMKIIAETLNDNGIASLRYDKRGVGKSINDTFNEAHLNFNQYVSDAIACITYLQKEFDHVIIAGHSLGALVGILAAQTTKVDKIICLAGISDSGYNTIKRQLSSQPKFAKDAAFPILDNIKNGNKVDSVPPFLAALFRPEIQGYLKSFISYNPQEEIKKLNIPILIIQGSTDIQITTEEAKKMGEANRRAKLILIDEMNHVLKRVSADINKNLATYSNPNLPLHEDLMPHIIDFITK